MSNSAHPEMLEELSEEIFELTKISTQARARSASEAETLSETENLALDLLSKKRVMTVGEIQKAIGVLPAQMSRIIRSLEDKTGSAYVKCTINVNDRRKIDVTITPDGERAHEAYRAAQLESITKALDFLTASERETFMRLLRKIRQRITDDLQGQ